MAIALIHFNHQEGANRGTWPDLRTSTWRLNYGDILVCIAILRQLTPDRHVRANFGQTVTVPIERALIRGSTYLHGDFDFTAANRTLDSLDAPIAVIGLGAQNPTSDPTFLDANVGARSFVARLNEKSASISVRGTFTAAVLERLGGKNIRITGCPSLFYELKPPEIMVPEMLTRFERSLAVTLHTGLARGIFCESPEHVARMHGLAVHFALNNASNVVLFEQGVMREYDVGDRALGFADRLEKAKLLLEQMRAKELFSPYDLLARMASTKSLDEWLGKARDVDAIFGFRFHGNMACLLQGRPCFFYLYDSRLAEFCELYRLPSQSVREPFQDPVKRMLDHDWSATNAQILQCFGEIRAFYKENGLSTVL